MGVGFIAHASAIRVKMARRTRYERFSWFGSAWRLARCFRRSAENSPCRTEAPFGSSLVRRGPVGETPTGATETVRAPRCNCIVSAKKEKKKYCEPFCRGLAHEGVNTMNCLIQTKRNQTGFTYENKT